MWPRNRMTRFSESRTTSVDEPDIFQKQTNARLFHTLTSLTTLIQDTILLFIVFGASWRKSVRLFFYISEW